MEVLVILVPLALGLGLVGLLGFSGRSKADSTTIWKVRRGEPSPTTSPLVRRRPTELFGKA